LPIWSCAFPLTAQTNFHANIKRLTPYKLIKIAGLSIGVSCTMNINVQPV
jgi:hypothetical protein